MTANTEVNPDERRIVEAIVTEALGRQFMVGVDGGGDDFDYVGVNKAKILEAVEAVEQANLFFIWPTGKKAGWALVIWGLGSCTLADYLDNEWVRAIVALAEQLQNDMDDRDEAACA